MFVAVVPVANTLTTCTGWYPAGAAINVTTSPDAVLTFKSPATPTYRTQDDAEFAFSRGSLYDSPDAMMSALMESTVALSIAVTKATVSSVVLIIVSPTFTPSVTKSWVVSTSLLAVVAVVELETDTPATFEIFTVSDGMTTIADDTCSFWVAIMFLLV
jgi:hypothetical protein